MPAILTFGPFRFPCRHRQSEGCCGWHLAPERQYLSGCSPSGSPQRADEPPLATLHSTSESVCQAETQVESVQVLPLKNDPTSIAPVDCWKRDNHGEWAFVLPWFAPRSCESVARSPCLACDQPRPALGMCIAAGWFSQTLRNQWGDQVWRYRSQHLAINKEG